jgi:dTDP-4-amino-4,6-dideoxygalactose transaminase
MIGGEFQIAVTDILNAENRHLETPEVYAYSSGRAALYQILKYLKQVKGVTSVLLPDYLCSSILVPVQKLGLEYIFYPIDEQLELQKKSFAELYKKGTAVLLINYFGLQDLSSQIKAINSIDENAVIIEDDVQAYYEFKKPLGNVDFKFTSLRKTFAVPDGGLVKTKHNLPKVESPNMFGQYKAAAALLKSMREGNFNDNIYLEMFEKGESLIDDELECGMSLIAEKLYSYVDEERVKVRRLNNATYLLEQFKELGLKPLLPLTEDHVPLFVPVVLKNRDSVRKAMFKQDIFCPVHWPLDGMNVKRGELMSQTELSLIIDQRYGRNDMDNIIAVLKEHLNEIQ